MADITKLRARLALGALLAGLTALAAGCQSSALENQPPAPGLKNTGEYPKFGNLPTAQTAQLGPDGTASLRSGLADAKASQNIGAEPPETYAEKLARLRRLALLHGQETIDEIEAK